MWHVLVDVLLSYGYDHSLLNYCFVVLSTAGWLIGAYQKCRGL